MAPILNLQAKWISRLCSGELSQLCSYCSNHSTCWDVVSPAVNSSSSKVLSFLSKTWQCLQATLSFQLWLCGGALKLELETVPRALYVTDLCRDQTSPAVAIWISKSFSFATTVSQNSNAYMHLCTQEMWLSEKSVRSLWLQQSSLKA